MEREGGTTRKRKEDKGEKDSREGRWRWKEDEGKIGERDRKRRSEKIRRSR